MLTGRCATVGRPIHCEQREKPTMDEVTRVQELYIAELMRYVPCILRILQRLRLTTATCRIWDTYKDHFARSRKRELSIVD